MLFICTTETIVW